MPGIHAAVATQPPSHLIAFDDDDDGFGEFTFAPVAAQPVPPQRPVPLQQQQQKQEDDDWGDFIVSPVGSHALGTASTPPSSPFDPFAPAGSAADAGPPFNGAKPWEKPRGALPLSIFGEEEAEADEPSQDVKPPASLSVSSPYSGQAAKDRSGLHAGGELRDLISSLYCQAATPQSKDGEKAGSSLGEGKEDDLEECSWDFRDAFSSSPNSVLKGNGTQKESAIASIAILDFNKAEVIQIRSGNPEEANGWIGDDSNAEDANNGITNGVVYTPTASSYKDLDIQDKTKNVPDGYDWFFDLDNRKKVGEDERWEFSDNILESKVETTSGQQSSEEQKIQAAEGKVRKTTNEAEVIQDVWKNNLYDWPLHSYGNYEKEADGRSFDDRNGHSSGPIFPENAVKDNYIPSVDLFVKPDQSIASYTAKDATKNGQNLDILNSFSSDLFKDHDLDEDHWEFLSASGMMNSNQNSAYKVDKNFSNKLTYSTVVDFYRRLKDGSISLLNCHLNGLKEAYEVSSFSGQQVKAMEINEEIKGIHKKLQEVKGTGNDTTEKHLPIDVYVNQLLEAVQEQTFVAFVQEYQLSERIISAGKKPSAAIKFLEHTTSVLEILALGSKEDQHAYVSAWSDLAASCAEELEHGATIWQELVQAQSFMQLSVNEYKYFIALGEIYRVAEVLKASARAYKPWILSDLAATASKLLSDALDRCDQAWNLYGLEDAFTAISVSKDLMHAGLAKAVLASIKVIHDLDLSHRPFSHEKMICAISLLSTQELQDMKMELWCGKHYFVKLANLWANRVSCEPPHLPHLCIR